MKTQLVQLIGPQHRSIDNQRAHKAVCDCGGEVFMVFDFVDDGGDCGGKRHLTCVACGQTWCKHDTTTPTADEENHVGTAIRDALLRWLDRHKAVCSGPDCVEPAGILGYLGHCLGVRATQAISIAHWIGVYEASCPGCTHLKPKEGG